ncbi:MAG: nucleotidyltransferase family protein [Pseudomonadota bacterium]
MANGREVLELPKNKIPGKAMILAAGLGTRMKPITDTIPKPLIKVHGKALLDHALDALKRAGINNIVVNVHHHADQIVDQVSKRKDLDIEISDETDRLLDSAGGIVNALPKLGSEPFYVLNADSFWIEGFKPNLVRLAEQWNPEQMDMLLLLAGMCSAVGFGSKGDFTMDADGRLERRIELKVAPFAYAGAAIVDPKVFSDTLAGPSSLNRQFDVALEKERLFGLRLEGLWLHVGTPDAIDEAEEAIARSAA